MMKSETLPIIKKLAGGVMAGVFLFTSVSEPLAESNFWAERSEARRPAGSGSGALAGMAWPKESLNPLLGTYQLPASQGSVVETHVAASAAAGFKTAPTLLHIQDAHGLYGAQYNSAQILGGLLRAGWGGSSLTVYQEGGTGPAHVEWLSAFPFADVREKVGRAHLRQGEVTGEEYRSLVESSGTVRLVGIESPELYRKNLAARHGTAAARAAAVRHIEAVQGALETLKARVYPPPLKALDKSLRSYAERQTSFVDYVQSLAAFSPVGEEYPNLQTLLRLRRLEAGLDGGALTEERTALVEAMGNRLPAPVMESLAGRALALREGRIGPLAFYESFLGAADGLKREGVELPTRRLRDYVGYLRMTENLNHEGLVAEAERLKDRLLEVYGRGPGVGELVSLDRRVALEKLLWRQEMTPEQYAAFRRTGALDWGEVSGFLAARGIVLPAGDLSWAKALEAVRDFYELALERDAALARNALADMEKRGLRRAVLIAGGFHTPGLARRWREAGAGYVILQPRFEGDAPRSTDLLISQTPDAFPHSVRETNALVMTNAPLPGNLPARTGAEFVLEAAVGKILSAFGEDRDEHQRILRAYMEGLDRNVSLKFFEVFQVGTGTDRQVVLLGEYEGRPFALARSLASNRTLWVSRETFQHQDVVQLNEKLEAVLSPRGLDGLWRKFVAQIRAARGVSESLQQALRGFSSLSVLAAEGIIQIPAVVDAPFSTSSREGQETMDTLSSVLSMATQKIGFRFKIVLRILAEHVAPRMPRWTSLAVQGGAVGGHPLALGTSLLAMISVGVALLRRGLSRTDKIKSALIAGLLGIALFSPGYGLQSVEAAQLSETGMYYLVEKGDVAWNIAKADLLGRGETNVTGKMICQHLARFAKANPGKDLDRIRPGEEIQRPPVEGKNVTVLAGEPGGGSSNETTATPPAPAPIHVIDPAIYMDPVGADASMEERELAKVLQGYFQSRRNAPTTPAPAEFVKTNFPEPPGPRGVAPLQPLVPVPHGDAIPGSVISSGPGQLKLFAALTVAGVAELSRRVVRSLRRSGGGPRTPKGIANQWVETLTAPVRTFPDVWWASLAKWMLKRSSLPRYNTPGAHARFSAYTVIPLIKLQVRREERRDAVLKKLKSEYRGLEKKIKKAAHGALNPAMSSESAQYFSKLKQEKQAVEDKIRMRRLEIQERWVSEVVNRFDQRKNELQAETSLPDRKTSEFSWSVSRDSLLYYKDKLIPEGFVLSWQGRVYLGLSSLGRLGFTGSFLSFVFFMPSVLLTTFSWVVFGPILFFISRTVVQPLVMLVMMVVGMVTGNGPRGHKAVDFLDFVREFAGRRGRPYSFSIEVSKISGNPMQGFVQSDVIGRFWKLTDEQEKAVKVETNDNPENPFVEVVLPAETPGFSQDLLVDHIKTTFWEGFRLDVNAVVQEDEGKTLVRIVPGGERLSQVIRRQLRDISGLVLGEEVVVHSENDSITIEIPELVAVSSPKNHKTIQKRLAVILSDKNHYNLPLGAGECLMRDAGPVRHVSYRFQVDGPHAIHMIPQNLDMRTRFLDTIHMEADVWAAYRRLDIANLAQTLRDAGPAFTVSIVMPTNTGIDFLIAYEMANLRKLQEEADREFPGQVNFLYVNQTIQWANTVTNMATIIAGAQAKDRAHKDPFAALNNRFMVMKRDGTVLRFNAGGDDQVEIETRRGTEKIQNQVSRAEAETLLIELYVGGDIRSVAPLSKSFTLLNADGSRDYFSFQGPERVIHTRTLANGDRGSGVITAAVAEDVIAALPGEGGRFITWGQGRWGLKLGNVAALEWLKFGFTRPPAYTDFQVHEHFTNPDAPVFSNPQHMAGDFMKYFHEHLIVYKIGATPGQKFSIAYNTDSTDSGRVWRTEGAQRVAISRQEANKELAGHIADFTTDRFTDPQGGLLDPNDMDLVQDDKNSVPEGGVETLVAVGEHPDNAGLIGFNPVINVDPPMNTRGGRAGERVASILLEYLDKSRRIHNSFDARFIANLFNNMSAMYGKLGKKAEYGKAFLNEYITISRALSHDWQESILSVTESVYGALTFRFEKVDYRPDPQKRSDVFTYRMTRGDEIDFIRLEYGHPEGFQADGKVAVVSRLNKNGEFKFWRRFNVPGNVSAKDAMGRISQYLSNTFEVNERDLLTMSGVMERDFRWLRGDIQMYSTTTPYAEDALPPSHQYHRVGIVFRLLGDMAFLFLLGYLGVFNIFSEQAFLESKFMANALLAFVMVGIAFRGHFLYPTLYDWAAHWRVIHSGRIGHAVYLTVLAVVLTAKNFLLSLLTIPVSTLMALPIAPKRVYYVLKTWMQELRGDPSIWKTSTSRAVKEMVGIRFRESWKEEIQQMNVVFAGLVFLLGAATLVLTGNVYNAILWPMGMIVLLFSLNLGWVVAHFAGQPYRTTDWRRRVINWFLVYGSGLAITLVVFFSPLNTWITNLQVERLENPPTAESILDVLADPDTNPKPVKGLDMAGSQVLQVNRTPPITSEPAPRILTEPGKVGAGTLTVITAPREPVKLTVPPESQPLPVVKTRPFTKLQISELKPLPPLERPKLTEEQTKKLAFLLNQLDRMNTTAVKTENMGIYLGSSLATALEPAAGLVFRLMDWSIYASVQSEMDYPWLSEPMAAKYWAQTAFLLDVNHEDTSSEKAIQNMKEISTLLLWDTVKSVWDADYSAFLQGDRELKDPVTGEVWLSADDYRDLAERVADSYDKYELLSTAVLNLHYGLGFPVESITPERVWRFIRLSSEIEKSWEKMVPNVDIRPVAFLPKPVSKFMRFTGNITFWLPVSIPVISELRLEMIPMVGSFFQEPGGVQEFFTQMLQYNEGELEKNFGPGYMAEFMKRIGAPYMQAYFDAEAFPPVPALLELVAIRMTEDMKKLNKVPSERDLRLTYLQTEYNLGRVLLFNQTDQEPSDLDAIRRAGRLVAKNISVVQSLAEKSAPMTYAGYMRFEPGVLEAEAISLSLLEADPPRRAEFLRVSENTLREIEEIRADMKKNGWSLAAPYIDHVLSLFPPNARRSLSPLAREYNALRDLALVSLNLKTNNVKTQNGRFYTPQKIMQEMVRLKDATASLRLPVKPGILSSSLMHWLKTKSEHPEITEKVYWKDHTLPLLRYWAEWTGPRDVVGRIEKSPEWRWFRERENATIEKEMGVPIADGETRNYNAVQSMAPLVDRVLKSFPDVAKKYKASASYAASLVETLAARTRAYDKLFHNLKNIPSAAVGFKEYFVVSGFELNGKNTPFDAGAAFEKEVLGFSLQPINDLWNTGVYEEIPKEFVDLIRLRMIKSRKDLGAPAVEPQSGDLKMQVLQVFYSMSESAIYSEAGTPALPPYGPAYLKRVVDVGLELARYVERVAAIASDLPHVRRYIQLESGIVENEAIQIYLIQKKSVRDNFKQKDYFASVRAIYQNMESLLADQPGLKATRSFTDYRSIRAEILKEEARKRITPEGLDFLALRSLSRLMLTAEHNGMKADGPLKDRALSPLQWMQAYADGWRHFTHAPELGGRDYQHIPYREEGFLDMVVLLKQKWGFAEFWEKYYYERLNQAESFLADPAFKNYLQKRIDRATFDAPKEAEGPEFLRLINQDIYEKSGILFEPGHPIYIFNGAMGLTEMTLDAMKKFPGYPVDYRRLVSRYLMYWSLFREQNQFQNLPYREEGFLESLVTLGYVFSAEVDNLLSEIRIMKLREVDALMGASFLDSQELFQGKPLRAALEGIVRKESAIPAGLSPRVMDFFILQKIVGLGQTYSMFSGAPEELGQPNSLDMTRDLPTLKNAMKALVYNDGRVNRVENGQLLYPHIKPIFDILGEPDKWVGRMYTLGLLTEDHFPDIFDRYIDVLEKKFSQIRSIYLPPERFPNGARYLGELGNYMRVLRSNLQKDAGVIEAQFIKRVPVSRSLVPGAPDKENPEDLKPEPPRVVFARPEIDENQFILDNGFLIESMLLEMAARFQSSGNPLYQNFDIDRLMDLYTKNLAYLKTKHYKQDLIRIQSYEDSEELGRLNGKINNYAMKFVFIDWLIQHQGVVAGTAPLLQKSEMYSIETFIDRFYENLQKVRGTPAIAKALDELHNANSYSAEGVEFNYAMMLTLNPNIPADFMSRFALKIPVILKDYSDFLSGDSSKEKSFRFRLDSAVVLYEALSRELESHRPLGRPLGDVGDRKDVKQKRINRDWMVRTLVKAGYGSLFGIYLNEIKAEDEVLLKEWEKKSRNMEFRDVILALVKAPTVNGKPNLFQVQLKDLEESIRERTSQAQKAKDQSRATLAEDYLIQVKILEETRRNLLEQRDYLISMADSFSLRYAEGIEGKNQAFWEMMMLISLLGVGGGLYRVARGRRPGALLGGAALTLYVGLPLVYIVHYGVFTGGYEGPRLWLDAVEIGDTSPYSFEKKIEPDVVFRSGPYVVRSRLSGGETFHYLYRGGQVIAKIDVNKGYLRLLPPPVKGGNGIPYPFTFGPSLVTGGFSYRTKDGERKYSHGGELNDIVYSVDPMGNLVLKSGYTDAQHLLKEGNVQFVFQKKGDETLVDVATSWAVAAALRVDDLKPMGEISAIAVDPDQMVSEGRPYESGVVAIRAPDGNPPQVYDFSNETIAYSSLTNILAKPIADIRLEGSPRHNSPAIRIVPQQVQLSLKTPYGPYAQVHMGSLLLFRPSSDKSTENLAVAPVVLGATGERTFDLPAGGRVESRYQVTVAPPEEVNADPEDPGPLMDTPPAPPPQESSRWSVKWFLGAGVLLPFFQGFRNWRGGVSGQDFTATRVTAGTSSDSLSAPRIMGGRKRAGVRKMLAVLGLALGLLAWSPTAEAGDPVAPVGEQTVLDKGEWRVLGVSAGEGGGPVLRVENNNYTELKVLWKKRQVYFVQGSGYMGATPLRRVWGTKFVTPGYWTSDGLYHHSARISAPQLSVDKENTLVLSAVLQDELGNYRADDFTIRFNSNPNEPQMEISFTLIAQKPFALDSGRLAKHEAFRIGQFSLVNNPSGYDADYVAYANDLGVTVETPLRWQNRPAFYGPRPLGPQGTVAVEMRNLFAARDTPTTYLRLGEGMVPSEFTPQGYIANQPANKKQDNVGIWLHWDRVKPSYSPSETIGRFRYVFGASSKPLFASFDFPRMPGLQNWAAGIQKYFPEVMAATHPVAGVPAVLMRIAGSVILSAETWNRVEGGVRAVIGVASWGAEKMMKSPILLLPTTGSFATLRASNSRKAPSTGSPLASLHLFGMAVSVFPAMLAGAWKKISWSLERPSGIREVSGVFEPSSAAFPKNGVGFVVDARGGMDPGVVRVLVDRFLEVQRQPSEGDGLAVEFIVDKERSEAERHRLKAAFQQLLQEAGVSRAVFQKTVVGFSVGKLAEVKNRVSEMSNHLRINVIAPSREIPFWASMGTPLTILAVATEIIGSLMRFEVELVFTGDALAVLGKDGSTGEGVVRFKAMASPLQILEQEQRALRDFIVQA